MLDAEGAAASAAAHRLPVASGDVKQLSSLTEAASAVLAAGTLSTLVTTSLWIRARHRVTLLEAERHVLLGEVAAANDARAAASDPLGLGTSEPWTQPYTGSPYLSAPYVSGTVVTGGAVGPAFEPRPEPVPEPEPSWFEPRTRQRYASAQRTPPPSEPWTAPAAPAAPAESASGLSGSSAVWSAFQSGTESARAATEERHQGRHEGSWR